MNSILFKKKKTRFFCLSDFFLFVAMDLLEIKQKTSQTQQKLEIPKAERK